MDNTLPIDPWRCTFLCDDLSAQPGTMRQLETHHEYCQNPVNEGKTEKKTEEKTEKNTRRKDYILPITEWVCKFSCDALSANPGSREQLRNHRKACSKNPTNIAKSNDIMSVDEWRCRFDCSTLRADLGTKRQLQIHNNHCKKNHNHCNKNPKNKRKLGVANVLEGDEAEAGGSVSGVGVLDEPFPKRQNTGRSNGNDANMDG